MTSSLKLRWRAVPRPKGPPSAIRSTFPKAFETIKPIILSLSPAQASTHPSSQPAIRENGGESGKQPLASTAADEEHVGGSIKRDAQHITRSDFLRPSCKTQCEYIGLTSHPPWKPSLSSETVFDLLFRLHSLNLLDLPLHPLDFSTSQRCRPRRHPSRPQPLHSTTR
jgi:hypothetical protein